MKIKIFVLAYLFLNVNSINSQTLSPQVIASAGGYFTAGGNSLSWTMGETFTATFQNGGITLTQGQQQPYVELTLLNLKLYIEGFYTGSGKMDNSGSGGILFISGNSADPLDCDTVTISAMNANPPYELINAQKGILKTNGDITVKFSSAVLPNNSYFIKINHRNSIETWSKNPVLLTSNTIYSFASNATQAFGNNEKQTSDHLYFALYSGDLNQDGSIDGSDFLENDIAIQNGDGGYATGDVNGDGAVDGSDFLLLDVNIQDGVGAFVP